MKLGANDDLCNRSAEDPQGGQTRAEVRRERNGRLHRMGTIGQRPGRARSRSQSQAHEAIDRQSEHIGQALGVCKSMEKYYLGRASSKSWKSDEDRACIDPMKWHISLDLVG